MGPPLMAPRISHSFNTKPIKGCLKTTTLTATTAAAQVGSGAPESAQNRITPRRVRFSALSTLCNTIQEQDSHGDVESHRDGKAWRHRGAAKARERQQAQRALLPGAASEEDQPLPPPPPRAQVLDPWADRGWESSGLGEDTPMGGMSPDMDVQAARWRELDQRLEEELALAGRNRAIMAREARGLVRQGQCPGSRPWQR